MSSKPDLIPEKEPYENSDPKATKQVRERVEIKLDAPVMKKLEQYCTYLESDRDYVVAQILDFVFRRDREFATWLAAQPQKPKTV